MNRESCATKTIVLASFFCFENISTPHEAIFNYWKMLKQETVTPICSVIYDCYFYAGIKLHRDRASEIYEPGV